MFDQQEIEKSQHVNLHSIPFADSVLNYSPYGNSYGDLESAAIIAGVREWPVKGRTTVFASPSYQLLFSFVLAALALHFPIACWNRSLTSCSVFLEAQAKTITSVYGKQNLRLRFWSPFTYAGGSNQGHNEKQQSFPSQAAQQPIQGPCCGSGVVGGGKQGPQCSGKWDSNLTFHITFS